MSDKFDDSLSFLSEPEAQPPKRKKKTSRANYEAFNTGLEDVSYKEAAKAIGSKSMAGQYKRFTVYLSPEMIVQFKEVAGDLGLSQAETGRWFFTHMYKLYEQGVRPETEEVIVRKRLKR